MIRSLKYISALILLIVTAFIYYGCGCACGSIPEADIPSGVLKNADEVIISKTGKEFFDKYITIDLQRSKEIPPDYFLVYRMIMPDKPYVNERIEFTVDAQGNLNKSFIVKGLPDCTKGECDFSINEQKAIEIAGNSGLDKGVNEWQTIFGWSDAYDKYVWYVVSTLSEPDSSQNSKGTGKEIIIDGNSGNVLEKNDWTAR